MSTADVTLRLGRCGRRITLRQWPTSRTRAVGRPRPPPPRAPACERTAHWRQHPSAAEIRDVHPIYPDTAEPAEGVVLVDVRIAADGSVASAVAREPANADLARAAVTRDRAMALHADAAELRAGRSLDDRIGQLRRPIGPGNRPGQPGGRCAHCRPAADCRSAASSGRPGVSPRPQIASSCAS